MLQITPIVSKVSACAQGAAGNEFSLSLKHRHNPCMSGADRRRQ